MREPQSSANVGARRALLILFCGALALAASLDGGTTDARAGQQPAAHQTQEQQARGRRYTRTVAAYTPPDVTLVDMTGAKVRLSSALDGEGPVMLQFIFTTCATVCPVMSGVFSAAQSKPGPELERVRMISISVDPENDTPARLREYARRFKAGRRWLFLTGELSDIIAVEKSFDAYRGSKLRHEPLTFLRASPKDEWVRLDGLMSAAELLSEYGKLVAR